LIFADEEQILQYEETFERASEGYMLNDSHLPHFCIPYGHGLSCLAKWIKLNNDRTISGYANTNGPSSAPHIIDLYAQPDDQYSEEAKAKLALEILAWFWFLMVGPAHDFALLHNALVAYDDWGLTREVCQYRNLDTEYMDICVELEQLQVHLDAIQQACLGCESCLQLARTAEQVEKLSNILCKPQANHSGWKHKSNGRGRLN